MVIHSRVRRAAGFTLPELVVTMAVTAILIATAIPSYSSLTASQRAKTFSSELYTTLLKTRSYAIQRNANATLSPIGGNWASGWQILDPANGTTVLEQRSAAAGVTASGPALVTFNSSGRVAVGSGTNFVITTTAGSATIYQCVSLDLGGRPYIKASASC